jgi:undecaprenyl-diphosphatase
MTVARRPVEAVLTAIARSDLRASFRIQGWEAPAWAVAWLRLASRAGDGGAWLGVAALLACGGDESRQLLLAGGLAAAVNNLCLVTAKRLVRRPRPVRLRGCGPAPPDPWSFPSGHSANAFMTCTLLGLAWPWLAPVWGALALSVAASRVVFGLHYPSDVVAGAGLGSISAVLGSSLLAA